MMDNLSNLVNVRLPEALNEVGMPADIDYLERRKRILNIYNLEDEV